MKTLFKMPKPDLIMVVEDLATSDDPLEAYLQRRGWDLSEVGRHQESISEKRTVDMFNGGVRDLSRVEIALQDDIEAFLEGQRRI